MRLTKSTVAQANYPEEKNGGAFYLWHDDPRGLGVRVYPSGRKSWVLTYEDKGRRRFRTLGPVSVLTLSKAREIALQVLGRLIEKRCARIGTAEDSGVNHLTIKELGAQFLEERCGHIKPRTKELYVSTIQRCINKKLGGLRASSLEREDVLKLRDESTPAASNLAVGLLNRMYQFAEETGALPVGTNPCRAIPTFKLKRRERYLSDEEIGRLAEALEWAKVHSKVSATTIHALYVILLTGCRHSEVRTLKWDYIDFQNSCLRFPDSKTGAKVVPVGSIVLKILRDLPRAQDSEYVFPGRLPGKPLLSLNPSWEPVRKRAGLKGVTIHDLRHTFATSASADGVDLERIQKLLVHTDKRMTLSYVHVLPRPSQEDQEAAEQISQALFGRLGGSAAGG